MSTRCPIRPVSVAIAAGLMTAPLASGAAETPSAGSTAKKIFAHYMPWYETPGFRGYWGNHWTGFNDEANPNTFVGPDGRRDIWSNYYPLIEPYDSADPHALECQLLQMKLAGIDGVIIDWYGISGAADYGIIQTASQAMFQASADFGLEFVACFEDRTVEFLVGNGIIPPSGINTHMVETFSWMHTNWFSSPHYFKRNGRPLVLNFGPIFVGTPGPWELATGVLNPEPELFALPHLWRNINGDGGFNWVSFSSFQGTTNEAVIRQRLNDYFVFTSPDPSEVIPSAVAGFDDVYAGDPFPFLDHRDGETFRIGLDVGMDGPWEVIQLVTWNDYGEGTMIEPTREFGYTFLEIVQDARRDEQGGAFAFTADDLRLPAVLYHFRKNGGPTLATMDALSDALNAGDTALARDLLAGELAGRVTQQPADAMADAGGTVVLDATVAMDLDGLSLRWERDGEPLSDGNGIAGATTETLTISGANRYDAGEYRLRVELAGAVGRSTTAIVGVRPSPLGIADYDNDNDVDLDDLLGFLAALVSALP
jgi:hypothetical protein